MTRQKFIKDYTPIDYRMWILGNEARTGVNIKKAGILTPEELRLWDAAVPFQDQRNDPGQGEMVALFAFKSLEYLPGIREIVVPAAILHDIGWYGCDPTAWTRLVKSGGETEGEANRRPHQNRGCMLAGTLMERINYPNQKYRFEISDIIGDHDTRKLPATESGERVRAGDLLWRVTLPILKIYYSDRPMEEAFEKLQQKSLYMQSPHNLGKIEQQIGKIEFANTIFFEFGERAVNLLRPLYSAELERITKFYK